MEQHRTRQPQRRQRPGAPPSPRGTAAGTGGGYRAPGARRVPPVVLQLRGLPNPRFTGLGAGLFATATMLFFAFLDDLVFDGSPLVYGLLFLPVSALTALWVRTADLVTAPIGVPIAFAVGTLPIAGGTEGFGGHLIALVTALAVHAGWLYGGTLVAGVIASVRKVRQMGRRQFARDAAAGRTGTGRTGNTTTGVTAPRTGTPRGGTVRGGTVRTTATGAERRR
ncbi:DUF6542 domain-containing protein [Streptomyces sp. NPDC051569]|uniref:DUF6542 domain-containing protein n=1 Tax=Streptomyces sp. NPDC051569 TaxID=3365661 RepID=UPI0037AC00DE